MVFETFFKMSDFEHILRQGYAAAASGKFVSSEPVEEKRLVPRAAPRPIERANTLAHNDDDDDDDQRDDVSHTSDMFEEELEEVSVKISDIVRAAPAEPNRAAVLRKETNEFFHLVKQDLKRVLSVLEQTEFILQNVPSRCYEQSLSLLMRRVKIWVPLKETLIVISDGLGEFVEETITRIDSVALAEKEPPKEPIQGVVRR